MRTETAMRERKVFGEDAPLFSFGILSYNNYCYITETLDSLFKQDYPNIELLISNDGSEDFDEQELIDYIANNKRENIKRVFVNNNAENIGTVQNINLVRQQARGEYIMYMAADDALYDETVLSRYVEEFERLGRNAMLVCSKTAMCSHDLEDMRCTAPDKAGIEAIKSLSPKQMFSRLSHTFTIPTTSTAYRMSLYEKLGGYDADYYIMEDAPLYIRMAREGIPFYWIDNMIGARHRDGGISHGNTLNLGEGYRRYRYDEITFFKKEVLPYKNRLQPYDRNKMQEKWEMVQREYDKLFVLPYLTGYERMQRRVKHAPQILWHLIQRFFAQFLALFLDRNFGNAVLALSVSSIAFSGLAWFGFSLLHLSGYLQMFFWLFRAGFAAGLIWMALQLLKIAVSLLRAVRFVLLGR
ncbi:glycosyltransferase [Pygmaiobacter massiliensis]|uniref:glycosyltransferase n=1 Tax=Pygmaiobacter massiliensis TaxID=1917873 RepID=UPI0028978B60|nr:glycosyltransferase [Pygmaiobacter massiliensis]